MRFPAWMEEKFPGWVLAVQVPVAAAILLYLDARHPYYRLFPLILAAGAALFWHPALSGRRAAWAPVYYFALISLLSSTTTATSRSVASFLFHPPEYFFLALLAFHAVRRMERPSGMWRVPLVLGICALLAALDEFHQSFVPGRVADPLDWGLDMGGAAAGILAYRAMAALGGWERASPYGSGAAGRKERSCN